LSPHYAGKVPLWIDDPLNPGQNIGQNSFAMYRVKASFEMAFHTLNPPYSYASVRSYLGRILSESGGVPPSPSVAAAAVAAAALASPHPAPAPVPVQSAASTSSPTGVSQPRSLFASAGDHSAGEDEPLSRHHDDELEKRTRSVSSSPLHNSLDPIPSFRRLSSQPKIDVAAASTAAAAIAARAASAVTSASVKQEASAAAAAASAAASASAAAPAAASSPMSVEKASNGVLESNESGMDERALAVLRSLQQEKSKSEALEHQVALLQNKTENLMQSVQERDEVIMQLKLQMEQLLEAVKKGSLHSK
jgi:hypothetical protein